MATYSDISRLVTRAQTGSFEAFSELVARFQDMAVGYAYGIIGDFQLAEDAAQEAFVGAWLDLPRLRDPAAFAGWFRKLVFRRCSRQTRAIRRGVVSTEAMELVDPAPSADSRHDEADRRRQVYRAIGTLSEEERLVTVLFYFGRHTHKEIASFLDLSPDTVGNRLGSARKKLKKGILDMARDVFRQHEPARDSRFAERVARLTRPKEMDTDRYLNGVAPVDGRDAWALFCACAVGDLHRVRALLDRDPNLVNAQYWYQFPIHMAVREGHADVVQLLLEEGADPGQSNYTYDSWDKLLATADQRGHRATKKLLQTAMAERFAYDERFEPVAEAIRARQVDLVDELLSESPDLINAADALGNSPVHWATLIRQLDLIDRFLDLGANIDARRADGRSPVHAAIDGFYWYRGSNLPDDVIKDPWIVARHLLQKGATLDLSMACMMGDVERVRDVLADDPDAARRLNSFRRSPLLCAARFGHLEVVRLLLEHRGDPAQPEDLAPHGGALHSAASRNDVEIAELLLKHGANPNAGVDSSADCLWISKHNHPEDCAQMQELLHRYGARPMVPWSDDQLIEELVSGERLGEDFLNHLFRSENQEALDLFFERHSARVPSLVAGNYWGQAISQRRNCSIDSLTAVSIRTGPTGSVARFSMPQLKKGLSQSSKRCSMPGPISRPLSSNTADPLWQRPLARARWIWSASCWRREQTRRIPGNLPGRQLGPGQSELRTRILPDCYPADRAPPRDSPSPHACVEKTPVGARCLHQAANSNW